MGVLRVPGTTLRCRGWAVCCHRGHPLCAPGAGSRPPYDHPQNSLCLRMGPCPAATPAAASCATSVIFTPGRYSKVSTLGALSCQYTRGTLTQLWSWKLRRNLRGRNIPMGGGCGWGCIGAGGVGWGGVGMGVGDMLG